MLLGVPQCLVGIHNWLTHTGTIILGVIGLLLIVGSMFERDRLLKKSERRAILWYGVAMIASFAAGFWFWFLAILVEIGGIAIWIHELHEDKKERENG